MQAHGRPFAGPAINVQVPAEQIGPVAHRVYGEQSGGHHPFADRAVRYQMLAAWASYVALVGVVII